MRESNKLTSLKVSRLTKPGRYADGHGLYLQVSAWGTKAWVFRYMKDGHARMMGLGDIHTFSLKEARERARAQRQVLADDLDPLEAKKKTKDAERTAAARAVTFKDCAERYIAAHRPGWRNEKHAGQWEASLATYAFPVIGTLPVAAVDVGLVLKVLEPIWTIKAVTASRVRQRIECVLDWASARGLRAGDNPARWRGHLERLLPETSRVSKVRHQPALPWRDVPAFMGELRADVSLPARLLEFIILTATRTGESVGARWDELDLVEKVWTIPPERTKTERQHRVPLSDRMLEILKTLPREAGSPFVFPGVIQGQPIWGGAALKCLRSMRPGLVVHGFRSSFRDWAAEATNFPRELSEAALAHVVGSKVEAAYRRGDVLEKRRRLMQAWDSYCARPPGSGKVLPLSKARA